MNGSLPIGIACLAAAIAIAASAPAQETKLACSTDEDCAVLDEPAVCYQRVDGGRCEAGLPVAPAAEALNLALLGRRAAAADVTWIQTLQFVGAPWADQVDYAGLEHWLQLVTDLDPGFAHAYLIGGVLLATIHDRAPAADALLQKAERNLTDPHVLSQTAQWRGFVAYYGAFDPQRAAEHYQRAYDLGGPPMLRERARTLRDRSADCRELWRSLSDSVGSRRQLIGGDMVDDRRRARILQNCFREELNRALSVRRISRKGDAETIEELVDDGLIAAVPPTLEDGKCWKAIAAKAYIRPCEESAP